MFELETNYLEELKDILGLVLKNNTFKVYAFGSRTKGRVKRASDIDLAVDSGGQLSLKTMEKLKDYFSVSDIPYKVDVLDLSKIDDDFRECIEPDFVEIKYK